MTVEVVVYTKRDCGLCGPVLETLRRCEKRLDFRWREVGIDGDVALEAKYGLEVPVVTISGRKAFKGTMTEKAFQKRIQRAAQAAAEAPSFAVEPVPAPPAWLVWGWCLALVVGVGVFAHRGWTEGQVGQLKLTAGLLRVESRQTVPPALDLPDASGRRFKWSDFAGKVVFLNFWATWCPPCVEEMPSMRRLYERFQQHPRFAMVAVSADKAWDEVHSFFGADQPGFRVLLDAGGVRAAEYGTKLFPETYIWADGRIIGFIEGPRDWDKWYASGYLDALLDGQG